MKKLIIESRKRGTSEVLLDNEDWRKVTDLGKWQVSLTGYVHKNLSRSKPIRLRFNKKYPHIYVGNSGNLGLHRFIMEVQDKDLVVDHINHNKLDNRKENLRVCTNSDNLKNSHKQSNNRSGYKGVHRIGKNNSHGKNWCGQISCDEVRQHQALYATAEEAALAYDKKAMQIHGEFAFLNFPNGPSQEILQKIEDGKREHEEWKQSQQASKQSTQVGVRWIDRDQKWSASIELKSGLKSLGQYFIEEEAIVIRKAAEKILSGNKQITLKSLKVLLEEQTFYKPPKRIKKQSAQEGVYWMERLQKWTATFSINNKRKYLGVFRSEQEAIDTRLKAEADMSLLPAET